jgi:hypothetical protein
LHLTLRSFHCGTFFHLPHPLSFLNAKSIAPKDYNIGSNQEQRWTENFSLPFLVLGVKQREQLALEDMCLTRKGTVVKEEAVEGASSEKDKKISHRW